MINKECSIEETLKKVHAFLEYAKASVKGAVALEQKFDGFCVAYDGYWTIYRAANYSAECPIPEDISEINELPECARNCWKLLMFRRNPEGIEASVKLLIPLLKSGEVKCFKHNGDVERREVLKYDEEKKRMVALNNAAYVIVIYTWGAEERDQLKAKLHSLGFTNIPYRRGCKMFESRFGHWKQWFKEG